MMEKPKGKINTKIDWNALDRCWAEQYEEEYGNLFPNIILNNHGINSSVSNIEANILVSA
jgi:hypothetical protein